MENNEWQGNQSSQVPQQPITEQPQGQGQSYIPQQPVQQVPQQQASQVPQPQVQQVPQQTNSSSSPVQGIQDKASKLKVSLFGSTPKKNKGGTPTNNIGVTKKKKDLKEMNINWDKLQKDDDIKVINVKGDLSAVPTIGHVKRSKKKAITGYIFSGIIFAIVVGLIVFCINIGINYRIVQGNVLGKDFNIAGFSFVNKNYDPFTVISDGAKIYYSEVSVKDKVFELTSDFKIGAVAKIYADKIAIGDNGIREMVIKKDQVRYVLEGD